jgi:hypothetical protein
MESQEFVGIIIAAALGAAEGASIPAARLGAGAHHLLAIRGVEADELIKCGTQRYQP